jgi:hypothetical protein
MSGIETAFVPWRARALRAAAMLAAMAAAGAMADEAPTGAAALSPPSKDICEVPRSLLPSSNSLRHIHAAWVKGEPVVIVAIGSGSTGSGANESHAFPSYLKAALSARFPGRDITVINHGHPGESAGALVSRFPTEVLPAKPSLVIWQTGTVDAVRSLDVDTFATTLNAGIAFLDASGSDVILVNPQYASRMELIIHYDPYLSAMEQAAGQSDAILFDRYRIMRYWAAKGRFDLSTGNRDARRKKAEDTQACVGTLLADVIARALH